MASLSLSGCGTTAGHDKTVGLADSYIVLGDGVGRSKSGVDQSLQALDALSRDGGSDARAAFDTITTSVTGLADSTTRLKADFGAAHQVASQHFELWGQQNASINDTMIKARAEQRRNDLSGTLVNLSGAMTRATSMNEGFVEALRDLHKYLSNDLSQHAVGNAGDLIAKVRGEGGRSSAALGSLGNDVVHFASKLRGN